MKIATFSFIERSNHMICISPSRYGDGYLSNRDLIYRDFSPLFYKSPYTSSYSFGQNILQIKDSKRIDYMTNENLFDVHHMSKSDLPYNSPYILDHTYWVDNVKKLLNWKQGIEIYFSVISDWDESIILVYNENCNECKCKIDEYGFLCSKLFIPPTRRHLYEDGIIFTEYQIIICEYNLKLEESKQPYIFK